MMDGAGLEGPRRLSPPAMDPSREESLSVEQVVWPSILFRRRPAEAGPGDRQCNVGFFIVDCHGVSDRGRHLVVFAQAWREGCLWNGSPVPHSAP